jgi:hypothetical protein
MINISIRLIFIQFLLKLIQIRILTYADLNPDLLYINKIQILRPVPQRSNLIYFTEEDVLLVEEEDAAGVVEEGVVDHLLEQVNALPESVQQIGF